MNCEALPRRLLRRMRWGSEKESLSTSWKSRGSAWKFCNKSRKLINLCSCSDSPKWAKIITEEGIGSQIIGILRIAQILTPFLTFPSPVTLFNAPSANLKSQNPQKNSGPHLQATILKFLYYLISEILIILNICDPSAIYLRFTNCQVYCSPLVP